MTQVLALLFAASHAWATAPSEEAIKKKIVDDYYQRAEKAFKAKHFTEAIAAAETVRSIVLKKDRRYLNKAKQIIDRAKLARKEMFDPFIAQAKEKFDGGDYQTSKDLCEEMLKTDPDYLIAKECVGMSEEKLKTIKK